MMPLNKPVVSDRLMQELKSNSNNTIAPKTYTSNIHTGVKDYSQYDVGSYALDDPQDSRAMQQTKLDAWGNILGRFAGNTALRVADGAAFLVTAPASLLWGLGTGEVNDVSSAASSIFDNFGSKAFRGMEEYLNEQMPIYQTKRQEASYSPMNLGFVNNIFDGLSYVASMYLGAGIISGGAKGISALGRSVGLRNVASLIADAAATGKGMDYVGSLMQDAGKLTEALTAVNGKKKLLTGAQSNFYDMWGGVVESAAEASQTRDTTKEAIRAKMLADNDNKPLNAEQEAQVQQQADEAGAWNFAANVFTTTMANKLVFNKMFRGKWGDNVKAHTALSRADETGEYLVKEAKSKTQKYLDLLKPAATGALVEGGQEGTQTFTNEFFVNLYKNPSAESEQSLEGIYDTLGNIGATAAESAKVLGTKEGVHSMLIGGLIGGPFNGVAERNTPQKEREKAQELAQKANLSGTTETLRTIAKGIDLSAAQDGAAIAGDQVTYETLKNHAIFDWVYSRNEMGKFSDIKSDLSDARNMPIEAFKDKYEIADDSFDETKKNKLIDYMETKALDTRKSYEAIMDNYGPKIASLSKEAPDMLKYLTMVDVHKKDYIDRETSLLTKLAPYLKPQELSDLVLGQDKLTDIENNIKDLDNQFKTLTAETVNDPEQLKTKNTQLSEIANKINSLQNLVATSVTEANYKDMMKLTNLEEAPKKEATDRTRYAEYSRDLADLKKIQKAKEVTINYYNRLVNDVDYVKKVQNQLNQANMSGIVKDIFKINANIQETVDEADPESKSFALKDAGIEAGAIQDTIKPGDMFSVELSYGTRNYDKDVNRKWDNFSRYMPMEVIDTKVTAENGVPRGTVELRSSDGRRIDMTADEFRNSIRPIQTGKEYVDYKYRMPKEEERFYKQYRDHAIKYQTKDGDIVTGLLGFSPYTPGVVLNTVDAEGIRHTTKFHPTAYKKGEAGYLEILSKDDTLAYKLQAGINLYTKELAASLVANKKAITTTEARIARTKQIIKDMKGGSKPLIASIKSLVKGYNKFADKLANEGTIKEEALQRLTKLKAIPFVVQETYPDYVNDVIKYVTEYEAATRAQALSDGTPTPKRLRQEQIAEAMKFDVQGLEMTRSKAFNYLKEIKQSVVNAVAEGLTSNASPTAQDHLSNMQDAAINPKLDDQYIAALMALEDVSIATPLNPKQVQALQDAIEAKSQAASDSITSAWDEYNEKILKSIDAGATYAERKAKFDEFRNAEYAAIARLTELVNDNGYSVTPNFRKERTYKQTNYELDTTEQEEVSLRPEFVLKSSVGVGANPFKLSFQENLPLVNPSETVARVIPEDEYPKYQLKKDGEYENDVLIRNPIYLELLSKDGSIPVGKTAMVTTLPLLTLEDSFGARFRDAEGIPSVTEVNKEFDAIALTDHDQYLDSLQAVQDRIVGSSYPDATKAYALLASKYLTDLHELRGVAAKGGVLEVSGKSNGRIKYGANGTRYITPDSKVVVATNNDLIINGLPRKTTPGRAYLMDESLGLLYPVVVDRLGSKTFTYGDKYPKKKVFVDNVIDGAKFLRASLIDKAYKTDSSKNRERVSTTDALTSLNGMVGSFLFQNRTDANPDNIFTFDINPGSKDVTFVFGKERMSLTTQEAEIRTKLQDRLFNIDRKALDKTIVIPIYEAGVASDPNTEVDIKYLHRTNYDEFVKDNFGLKSNIEKYESGYITLSGKTSRIDDSMVAAPSPRKAAAVRSVPRQTRTTTPLATEPQEEPEASAVPRQTRSTTPPNIVPLSALPEQGSGVRTGDNRRGKSVPTRTPSVPPTSVNTNTAIDLPTDSPALPTRTTGLPTRNINRGNTMLVLEYANEIGTVMNYRDFARAQDKFENKYEVPFQLVKGLIDNDAFGLVTTYGETLLSDQAPKGADYHEEFHVVSQHILPAGELNNWYNKYREEYNSEVTDDVAEEKIAELYRAQALGYEGITGFFREAFDKFTKLLRKLIGLKPKMADVLLDIYAGKYYGRPVHNSILPHKMSIFDGDTRTDVERIPQSERDRGFSASMSKFVRYLRFAVADTIPLTEEESNLSEFEDRTPEEDARYRYLQQERQKTALTSLITNSNVRRDILNVSNEFGETLFNELVERSLHDYIVNTTDTIGNKFWAVVDEANPRREKNYNDLLEEYTNKLVSELNLTIPELQELDEFDTDKGIVKVGDTNVDFFQDGMTQIKLFAYTQMENNGVYPINVSKLHKILFDNLTNLDSDDAFFARLGSLAQSPHIRATYGNSYNVAMNNLVDLTGLSNTEVSLNDKLLQQLLFGTYNKAEVDFRVLKIADDEKGKIRRYWVDQGNEKRTENVRKDFVSNFLASHTRVISNPLVNEYRTLLKKVKLKKKDQDVLAKLKVVTQDAREYVLNELTGLNHFDVEWTNELNTILDHFVLFGENPQDYLNLNKGNVSELIKLQSQGKQEKIFALRNAKGNPQYSLQNRSSIHNELKDYHEDITYDEAKEFMLQEFVYLNGTQYAVAEGDKGFIDTEYASTDDLPVPDLLMMYYKAVTDTQTPMIPFIFSGDKSAMGGFTMSGEILRKDLVGEIARDTRMDDIFLNELYDLAAFKQVSTGENTIQNLKLELPFYTLLNTVPKGESLYNSIKDQVLSIGKNDDPSIVINTIYEENIAAVRKGRADFFATRAKELMDTFQELGVADDEMINVTPQELGRFAEVFAIGINEQTKLTGSLAFYKDPFKRLYAWTSAKRRINNSEQHINWYNSRYGTNHTHDYNTLVVDDIGDFATDRQWKDNNPADAQAWITMDTARFMLLGSGVYNPQMEELFDEIEHLDNKGRLSESDIEDLNRYTGQVREQLNVLKPQAFGKQLINGLKVPTFYKLSVMPITRAATSGKNLERVLDLMRDNNLQMVMVESANKVGRKVGDKPVRMYDENGNFVLDKEYRDSAIQSLSWDSMGLQVDMPNNHSEVTVGTQARKLFTENLAYLEGATYEVRDDKGKLTPMSGSQVTDLHEALQQEKTKFEFDSVREDLGIDENFRIKDIDTLKKKLNRLVSRSSSSSVGLLNDIQSLDSYDVSTNKAKLQAVINSLLAKGVIRQKTTGDSKAMVSSVGFERANDNIKDSKALKFYEDVDGKRYMEVYIPLSMSNIDMRFLRYDADEGVYKFKDVVTEADEELVKNMQSIIGYRIPTQAQASIENIRIKGFLPSGSNSIVVPFELTSKAGSDFDIDKLYLYLPRFEKGKYIKDHIDNRLLRFYTDLMSSLAYYKLFVKTIDSNVLKDTSKEIENRRPDINKKDGVTYHQFIDADYSARRRYSFISAKQTLGAAALAVVHHAESQKHSLGWINRRMKGSVPIYTRITDNTLGELLERFVPGMGRDEVTRFDRVYSLKSDGSESSTFISDTLSEFVNAFVDAAKDDYITSANIDLKTINVAMMLVRAGVPADIVLNFLAQPGVIAYTNISRNDDTKTRRRPSYDESRALLDKLAKGRASSSNMTNATLLKTIGTDSNTSMQTNYAAMYRDLYKYAQFLGNLQQVTTFDTKATGRSIENNELNLFKFKTFLTTEKKYWHNIDSMINASTSFQGTMREVASKTFDLSSQLFQVQRLYTEGDQFANKELVSEISNLHKSKKGTDYILERENKIKNYFITHILQKQAAYMLKGGARELAGKVQTAIKGISNYAGDNEFVKNLKIIDRRIYNYNGASLSNEELTVRQSAFNDLWFTDNALARDIVFAGIASHGVVNNPNTFMNQIDANSILTTIGVVDRYSPLLTMYNKLSTQEKSIAVRNSVQHASKAYQEIISNFTLEAPSLAPAVLNESYKCK